MSNPLLSLCVTIPWFDLTKVTLLRVNSPQVLYLPTLTLPTEPCSYPGKYTVVSIILALGSCTLVEFFLVKPILTMGEYKFNLDNPTIHKGI